MREIRKSGSAGGAARTDATFLALSLCEAWRQAGMPVLRLGCYWREGRVRMALKAGLGWRSRVQRRG